jgi:hypothetical protein
MAGFNAVTIMVKNPEAAGAARSYLDHEEMLVI